MVKRGYKKGSKNYGLIFVFVGIFFIATSLFIKFRSDRILSFSGEVEYSTQSSSQVNPVEISIESAGINLGVTEGTIENGIWEISKAGATHLSSSKNPGESGNIVIYGHNKSNLFGKLTRVNEGDIIKVKITDGKIYSYVVSTKITVSPDKIEFVQPKNTETLTLYTCTGFMDTKRFIVIAKPS